jgi:dTDP-4-dehydrorhamnose 3,5-epimerase-like enzyme
MKKKKYLKTKYIKIKKFYSKGGYLFSFENNIGKLPIKIKRIFFTIADKNSIRGEHAHKFCSQIIVCLQGEVGIKTIDKTGKKKYFILKNDKNALFVPNLFWNTIKFKKKKTTIAVMCDYKYDRKKDYLESLDDFYNY